MGITGIICEFNPLHNGHQLLVQRAKSLFPNNDIALIMSGNVVQRGELAAFDKATRATWAIQAGADIVFELPAVFSNSYAMQFARGGIRLLSQIHGLTDLVFGSECGDVELLRDFGKNNDMDDSNFKSTLHSLLHRGFSYPRALSHAVETLETDATLNNDITSLNCNNINDLNDAIFDNINHLDDVTNSNNDVAPFLLPNNILGVEYIRAIEFFESKIIPHSIPREKNEQTMMSASEIRQLLLQLGDKNTNSLGDKNTNSLGDKTSDHPDNFSQLKPFLPQFVFEELTLRTHQTEANDDLFKLLKSKILTAQTPLATISEVTEGIENRFIKGIELANSYQEYIHYIKTKRYTMAKIKRILISILLDKTKLLDSLAFSNIDYIKVLAVNSSKKSLLGLDSSLKFITKTGDFSNLDGKSAEFLRLDKTADDLFNICNQKNVSTIYTHKMHIVD